MTYIKMISTVLKVSDPFYEMITVPFIINTWWIRPIEIHKIFFLSSDPELW